MRYGKIMFLINKYALSFRERHHAFYHHFKILIKLFAHVDNKPMTAFEMKQLFDKLIKQGPNIRTLMAYWTMTLKHSSIPMHKKGKDGCIKSQKHRICCKKNDDKLERNVYWIDWDLARHLFYFPDILIEDVQNQQLVPSNIGTSIDCEFVFGKYLDGIIYYEPYI